MVRPKSQSGLLKEARESWEYIISNELVYADEIAGGDDNPFGFISEEYIEGSCWLDLEMMLIGKPTRYCAAIIEPLLIDGQASAELNVDSKLIAMKRDSSVFVDVPKFMQSPQFATTKAIPVIVRLKLLDLGDSETGDPCRRFIEEFHPLTIEDLNHRERSLVVTGSCGQPSQLNREVVQRGSKAGNEISQDQTQRRVKRLNFDPHSVFSQFRIVLSRNSVGVRLAETRNPLLKSIKVTLRPVHLQCGLKMTGEVI